MYLYVYAGSWFWLRTANGGAYTLFHTVMLCSSPLLSSVGPGKIGEHTVDTYPSSISLNWASPPGEVFKYRVEWNKGDPPMFRYTYDSFAVLSDLIPGTTYTITVVAVAGDNLAGEPYTFTSVTSKPHFLYLHTRCYKMLGSCNRHDVWYILPFILCVSCICRTCCGQDSRRH